MFDINRCKAFLALVTLSSLVGCAVIDTKEARNYDTISAGPKRDTSRAAELNAKALKSLNCEDVAEAKIAIDKALIADVDYAPAHNPLGNLLYSRKDYYLSAWEFEFAIRLQPTVPEYHNNLGLVYEAAGKWMEAAGAYQMAMELEPDNYHFVSNLTRLKIRQGQESPETRELLERVVYMDPRPEWNRWAEEQLHTTHLDMPSGYSHDVVPLGENHTAEPLLEPTSDPSDDSKPPPELPPISLPIRPAIDPVPEVQSPLPPEDNWMPLGKPTPWDRIADESGLPVPM